MRNNHRLSASDLNLVLILYRNKTLTNAAIEIGVEQSTLSRQLTMLEEKLNSPLFLRHKNGLTPSKTVVELIKWAEEIESVLRNANHDIQTQLQHYPEVHISCPAAIADFMLAPHTASLFESNKTLRLRLTGTNKLLNLDALECDISIRIGERPRGDIVSIELAKSRVIPFGVQKFVPEIGSAHLADLPVLHRFEVASDESKILVSAMSNGFQFAANRMTTSILAAEHGAGVVFLPEQFGNLFRSLVPIPVLNWDAPIVSIFLASPRALRRLPHVNIVWDWVKNIFSNMEDK